MDVKTLLLETTYTGALFKGDLLQLIFYIGTFVGVLLTLYAVYIAYLFASAVDESKRRAAKNRLIKVFGSVVIIAGLISFIKVIDIRFNQIDVPIAGNDDLGVNSSVYTYDGSISEINIAPGTTPTISLFKNRIKDGKSTVNVTNITSLTFNDTKFNQMPGCSFTPDTSGKFKLQIVAGYSEKISFYTGSDGKYFFLTIDFEFEDSSGNQSDGSVNVWVKINTTSYEQHIANKHGSAAVGTYLVSGGTKV